MQPYNEYEIGQTAVLEGKATNSAGQPAAPVSPQILLKDPSGTETSLAIETDEDEPETFFHELYITGPAGLYSYRVLTATDAEEHFFYVKPGRFVAPLG